VTSGPGGESPGPGFFENEGNAMNVLSNIMNWDPVAWVSILMVLGTIVVGVFLYFKVGALIKRDAESHKNLKG
jgi:hypothetical protein